MVIDRNDDKNAGKRDTKREKSTKENKSYDLGNVFSESTKVMKGIIIPIQEAVLNSSVLGHFQKSSRNVLPKYNKSDFEHPVESAGATDSQVNSDIVYCATQDADNSPIMVTSPIESLKMPTDKEIVIKQSAEKKAGKNDAQSKKDIATSRSDDEDSDDLGDVFSEIRKAAQNKFPPHKEIIVGQNVYKKARRRAIKGKKVIKPNNNCDECSDDLGDVFIEATKDAQETCTPQKEILVNESFYKEAKIYAIKRKEIIEPNNSYDECSDDLGDVFNEVTEGTQETFPPQKNIVVDQNAGAEAGRYGIEGKKGIEPNNSYDKCSDDLEDVFNKAIKGAQEIFPPQRESIVDQNDYKDTARYTIQGKKVVESNNSADKGSNELGSVLNETIRGTQKIFPSQKEIIVDRNVHKKTERNGIKGKKVIKPNNIDDEGSDDEGSYDEGSDDEGNDDLGDVFNEAIKDVQDPLQMKIIVDNNSYKDTGRYAIKGKKLIIKPNNSDDEGSDNLADILDETIKGAQEIFPLQKEIVVEKDSYKEAAICVTKGKKVIELNNSDDEDSDDLEDLLNELVKDAQEIFSPQKEIIVNEKSYKEAGRHDIKGKKAIIEASNSDGECSDDLGDVFSEAMEATKIFPAKETLSNSSVFRTFQKLIIQLLPNTDTSDFWDPIKTELQDTSDICPTQYIVGQFDKTSVKRLLSTKDDEFEDCNSQMGRKSKKRKDLKVLNSKHSSPDDLSIIGNSNKVEKWAHIKHEKKQDGHNEDNSSSDQESVKCEIIEVDGDIENEDETTGVSPLTVSDCDRDDKAKGEHFSRFEFRSGGRNANMQLLDDSKDLSDSRCKKTFCNQAKVEKSKVVNESEEICDVTFQGWNLGWNIKNKELDITDDLESSKSSILINHDTTVRTANTRQHQTRKCDLERPGKLFKCNQCNYQTVYKGLLKTHGRRHNKYPNEMLKCDHCKYQTINKYHYKRHLLLHNYAAEDRMFKCNQCPFQSTYKRSLMVHRFQHNSPKHTFKCDQCNFITIYKSALKRHLYRHRDPAELHMFKCDQCDFQSIYRYSLKEHIFRHKNPKKFNRFKCDLCDYQTFRTGKLKEHFLCHNEPAENFKCDQCPYQSMNQGALYLHLLSHKNAMDVNILLKCDQCEYRTIYRSALNRHILGHEKPAYVNMLKCHRCNFYTIYESVLDRHYLRHKDQAKVKKV